MMTSESVLRNLKTLIGEEMDYDNIISEFEDFQENEETNVYVGKSDNGGYDYIAYINTTDSTQFMFTIDGNNIITDVWM